MLLQKIIILQFKKRSYDIYRSRYHIPQLKPGYHKPQLKPGYQKNNTMTFYCFEALRPKFNHHNNNITTTTIAKIRINPSYGGLDWNLYTIHA